MRICVNCAYCRVPKNAGPSIRRLRCIHPSYGNVVKSEINHITGWNNYYTVRNHQKYAEEDRYPACVDMNEEGDCIYYEKQLTRWQMLLKRLGFGHRVNET